MPLPDPTLQDDWLARQDARWNSIQDMYPSDQIILALSDTALNTGDLTISGFIPVELMAGAGNTADVFGAITDGLAVADLGLDQLEVLDMLIKIDLYQQSVSLSSAQLDYLNMRALSQAEASKGLFSAGAAFPPAGIANAVYDVYALMSGKLQTNEALAKNYADVALATNITVYAIDGRLEARYDNRISGPIASQATLITDAMMEGTSWYPVVWK